MMQEERRSVPRAVQGIPCQGVSELRRMRADLVARSLGDAAQRQGQARAARTAGEKPRRVDSLKTGKRAYARVPQDRSVRIKHASPACSCEIKRIARHPF